MSKLVKYRVITTLRYNMEEEFTSQRHCGPWYWVNLYTTRVDSREKALAIIDNDRGTDIKKVTINTIYL